MFDFHQKGGEQSKQENVGFADLADISQELRFGDLGGMVHGFYKHLASWEDQEDAQALRNAAAAFYSNPTDKRSSIPESYATELQIVFNALADMYWPVSEGMIAGASTAMSAVAVFSLPPAV